VDLLPIRTHSMLIDRVYQSDEGDAGSVSSH
jgi:hypothetical protein